MQKISVIKNALIFSLFIFLLAFLSIKNYSFAVTEGILLYINCLLPSIFPYLVLTSLINGLKLTDGINKSLDKATKKLFNVNGNVGVAFIISLISGYPIGAKIISDLKKENLISDTEAIRGSIICSTSSPAFLITSIGIVFFNDVKVGLILFLSQFVSSFVLGIVFSFYKKGEGATPLIIRNKFRKENVITDSIISSVSDVMVIGGTIAIFHLFSVLLLDLKILSPFIFVFEKILKNKNLAKGLTVGLIESTSGINVLVCSKSILSIALTSFICGFGGLSIIMQSISFLKSAKIKTAPFFISKTTSAVLNFIVTYLLCLIFL